MDLRKRLEKKLKKTSKSKDIDQNLIDEELARIIAGNEKEKKELLFS